MRLSRLLPAVAVLALARPAVADDTKAFLDPANWEGRTDIWKVENGVVVGDAKEDPKYNTFLCSKKQYGDFDLSFKVRMPSPKGNSGIQFRSVLKDPKKFIVYGPQADIGAGYWGSLYGEGVGGYLLKAKGEPVKGKEAEFNDFFIAVRGNHVTIKVNGEVTVDADIPDNKGKNPAPATGIIAFQMHGNRGPMQIEFKDIRFTDLSKK